jgi:hypothetical protein
VSSRRRRVLRSAFILVFAALLFLTCFGPRVTPSAATASVRVTLLGVSQGHSAWLNTSAGSGMLAGEALCSIERGASRLPADGGIHRITQLA